MNHSRYAAICCLLLLSIAGCRQSIGDRLLGDWVGKPDTAAAAAERSAQLKAKSADKGGEEDTLPVDEEGAATRGKTDLEQHNVSITLRFENSRDVKMSIAQGGPPLEGSWRVVQTLPPRGAEIEISLKQPNGKADGKPKTPEKRRFVIDFQGDDADAGFTLFEKGADPQFGRLYFQQTK